jgi:UDP-N-acetylglucosamine--N-acetylmuramyl-(pentapeptide) pyrophosphoryl-undecaprenol N-acetylglucosamine transferase
MTARVLAVSSGGGHLKQLQMLLPRAGFSLAEIEWVTFDTGLSADLPPEQTTIVPYAAPRDMRRIAKNQAIALRILRRKRYTHVISTGASLAACYLPAAAAMGAKAIYIESATRALGPSLTGRILRSVPGVHLYTQYNIWADRRWKYAGCVFDSFTSAPRQGSSEIRTAVVSLGTTESYRFDRLIRRAKDVLGDRSVLWQTGPAGSGIDLPNARAKVPSLELRKAIQSADVVISHAGTGSALTALELGKVPVLVPRSARHGEHVDDHQHEIARQLAVRKLAVVTEADAIDVAHLLSASNRQVAPVTAPSLAL